MIKYSFGNLNNMFHLGFDRSRALMRNSEKHNLALIHKVRQCPNLHSNSACFIDGAVVLNHDANCFDEFVANYKL